MPASHVKLRLLTQQDRATVHKWLADPYILQLTFVVPGPAASQPFGFSPQAADRYFDMLLHDMTRQTFAIEVDGLHVGNIGLKSLNRFSMTSDCFIEVGEAPYRDRGVGTSAMMILLDYGFYRLGLKEVRLEVLEFNERALNVYQKLGFVRTHRSGWHYDQNLKYWQVLAMALGKERWLQRRSLVSLRPDLQLYPLSSP